MNLRLRIQKDWANNGACFKEMTQLKGARSKLSGIQASLYSMMESTCREVQMVRMETSQIFIITVAVS